MTLTPAEIAILRSGLAQQRCRILRCAEQYPGTARKCEESVAVIDGLLKKIPAVPFMEQTV